MVVETQILFEHLLFKDLLGEAPVFLNSIEPGAVGDVVDDADIVGVGVFLDLVGPVDAGVVQ